MWVIKFSGPVRLRFGRKAWVCDIFGIVLKDKVDSSRAKSTRAESYENPRDKLAQHSSVWSKKFVEKNVHKFGKIKYKSKVSMIYLDSAVKSIYRYNISSWSNDINLQNIHLGRKVGPSKLIFNFSNLNTRHYCPFHKNSF